MDIRIDEEPIATLCEQDKVSIAFEYDRILEPTIVEDGLGGCKLGAINRMAYPQLPDEIQLLWYKEI